MVEVFTIFQGPFSLYIVLSLLASLVCSLWLLSLFLRSRFLFIKPSILLLSFTHILFQWPFTIYAGFFESWLPQPEAMFLLIHGFVGMGLLISAATYRKEAKEIWARATLTDHRDSLGRPSKRVPIRPLLALGLVCLAIYLAYVPWHSTALVALFLDPASADQAREQSLKLVENPLPRYAFSVLAGAVIPLLTGIISYRAYRRWHTRKGPSYFSLVLSFCLLGIVVSLTGERSRVVYMLLVATFVCVLCRKFSVPLSNLLWIIPTVLAPAVLVTLFRESRAPGEFLELWANYLGYIARRAFVTPLMVGGWYVHYAQTYGEFGIAAFPKVASLMGTEAIDASNLIALTYFPVFEGGTILTTMTAGGGYLLTYFGYLGAISFPLCLLGLFALDIALVVFRRLEHSFLVPCLGAAALGTLHFVHSDYTVAWVTHGFGPTLLIAWILGKHKRVRRFVAAPASVRAALP